MAILATDWSSCLLAPSRAEGLPTALVEARAAGIPTIATDVGGVADALHGYQLGRVIPADDDEALDAAISAVLDGAWPQADADPGPLPDRFSSEVIVDEVVALYDDLLRNTDS